jgi:type IV secretory pathway VirB2 component (pilin)
MSIFSVLQLINPQQDNLPRTQANNDTLQAILTDVFVLLGAIAIFMIVVAGLLYITARGNPEKVTTARNRILYSVMGLVLAASAAAIVNVVLGRAG